MQTGVAPERSASGPMAEVIGSSLQHLTDDDAKAIAGYLKSLPQQIAPPAAPPDINADSKKLMLSAGAKLYEDHCVSCHQASGKGVPAIYPALAGNPAVTSPIATNVVHMVLQGGFAPGTAKNPRPYGMPPFGQSMSDSEVAAVITYIRNTWGNRANAVSPVDVNHLRSRQGQQ
jgi:mono/diheme cytochrome c family protein